VGVIVGRIDEHRQLAEDNVVPRSHRAEHLRQETIHDVAADFYRAPARDRY